MYRMKIILWFFRHDLYINYDVIWRVLFSIWVSRFRLYICTFFRSFGRLSSCCWVCSYFSEEEVDTTGSVIRSALYNLLCSTLFLRFSRAVASSRFLEGGQFSLDVWIMLIPAHGESCVLIKMSIWSPLIEEIYFQHDISLRCELYRIVRVLWTCT